VRGLLVVARLRQIFALLLRYPMHREIVAHLAFHGPLPLRAGLPDALDRGEQDLESQVDEVDVGHRDRDIAREDDPVVDGTVDEVEQGDLPGLHQGWARAHGVSSSVGAAKLYGAQGPL